MKSTAPTATLRGVGLHAGCRSRQVAEAFVDKVQRGVDRQPAELSQKHAREAQTVLGARKRHLGFVQLDAHRQRIGTGGHAFFHHFLHVAVQMLQHVAVGRGQTRLVRQAHHLPVSFVHTENHLLTVGAQLFAGQLLGIAGDAVVGANFSAHVERLGEEHRTHGHIACVGLEALRQIAPHTVQSLLQSGAGLLRALHERSEIGVCSHELLHPLHEFGRETCAQLRTEVAQRRFLVSGEDRKFVARVNVGGHARDFGQIVRAGGGMHLAGFVDAQLRHLQRLVVLQGQLPATVEREGAVVCGRGRAAR